MNYRVTTIDRYPDHEKKLSDLSKQVWPEFLSHTDDFHWGELSKRFASFQLLFTSGNDHIGAACTVPLHWNDVHDSLPNSIEQLIISAIGYKEIKKPANTLAVLAVMVSSGYREEGMHETILNTIKQLAKDNKLKSLMVPVRPTLKSRYPLTPFGQYVNWKQPDGNPFDPWLRAHWKMGASVLGALPKALTVEGSVEEWEIWTNTRFSESGEFIVEGALNPVIIDCAHNEGRYEEPNLVMLHRI